MSQAKRGPTAIGDLIPDPENRRAHNDRNIGMIKDSIREVGLHRSIVIDEGDVIRAGNGVTQAALEAGLSKLRIIEAEGDELIAVRRRNLTEEQKRALAIFDNRTAELSAWNFEQLAADKAAGLTFQPYWTTEEEAAIFGHLTSGASASKTLAERFGVPPFSVLDARQGYWQTRKAAWIALGIESELGRGAGVHQYSEGATIKRQGGTLGQDGSKVYKARGSKMALETSAMVQRLKPSADQAVKRAKARVSPGGSPRPAMRLGKDGRTVRGDGRGRPLEVDGISDEMRLLIRHEAEATRPIGPPLVLETHEGITVVRDDRIEGGSKMRFLPALVPEGTAEVVFGGPFCGGAPLALSVLGRMRGIRVTLFYAARKLLHSRQAAAQANGAKIVQVPHGYMTHVQAKARAYAAEAGALFFPLGFDTPEAEAIYVAAIREAAQAAGLAPREVWCATGSGMLARCLGRAFPDARIRGVAVGLASRWQEQDFPPNVTVVPAGVDFATPERQAAPFPSCPNYDRKAWIACRTDTATPAGEKLFWNVLGDR